MLETTKEGFEVERTLVVSTGHVEEAIDQYLYWLTEKFRLEAPIVVNNYSYGWLIYVPSDKKDFEDHVQCLRQLSKTNNFTAAFINLFKLAHNTNCTYLKLDRDGPLSPDLQQFDW